MIDTIIKSILSWLSKVLQWDTMPSLDNIDEIPAQPYIPASVPPVMAPTASSTPEVAHTTETKETLLWDTPRQAFKSTRIICDEIGLTFKQKEILCACVFQESEFLTNPKPNQNIEPKTGKVWSTDFGIVQVNDYWHIGKGKTFKSVDEVITNPEKCIRWMAGVMKVTGELQPWSSYTSGAYKKHLSTTSRMRRLQVV